MSVPNDDNRDVLAWRQPKLPQRYDTADQRFTKAISRALFIGFINQERPDVPRRLFEATFPLFVAAYLPGIKRELASGPPAAYVQEVESGYPEPALEDTLNWSGLASWSALSTLDHESADAHFKELRDSFLKWSSAYRLRDGWILEAAFRTLQLALLDEHVFQRPLTLAELDPTAAFRSPLGTRGTTSASSSVVPEGREDWTLFSELRFTFEDRGFLPWYQSWADYEERVTWQFLTELREYRERLDSLLRSRGFVPARDRRHRVAIPEQWVIRYVIGRETYEEIASCDGVSSTAVRNRVRDFAELIGLTLPDKQAALRT